MKKHLVVFMLLAIAPLFVTACGPRFGGQVKGDSFITEGWIDDNTFRVVAAGVPNEKYTNKIQRRETAKDAALINAQARIIEKFVGSRLEGATGSVDSASTGKAIQKEFSGVVKGGTIVKVNFDDDDNCEVVYQVFRKGLKKQVMGGGSQISAE